MNRKKNSYKTLNQIQKQRGDMWYHHYYNYLSLLTFQLFEWKGLPDSIDPRYLEMSIHQFGFCGFFKDKNLGYMVSQGALSGQVNHYLRPTRFQATSPRYSKEYVTVNYMDEGDTDNPCVVIYNNDMRYPSLSAVEMFAYDLTELKEIIHVNQNAQKTPVLLLADDEELLTWKNIYNQYENNSYVIIANKNIDPERIKVHKTDAPYVVDKLNTQRNAVWNEMMTFLGIKNANMEKKERMLTDEARSNDEQIDASGNIMLKARQEACKLINETWGLNVSVDIRVSAFEEFKEFALQQTQQSPMTGGGRE